MLFVMLVRVDPDLPVPADSDVDPWVEEGRRTGTRLGGAPAEDPSSATTVRVRDGATLVADGPALHQREAVAGYDLLEAEDLDAAIDSAAQHPVAAFGALEVREVWEDFVPGEDAPAEPDPDGVDYLFLHVPDHDLLRTATREGTDPTEWVREVARRRVTLGGHRLRDEPEAGAVVRRRDGELLVTRGPFAELTEQIAGIDLVRVADLDEAIGLAETHPTSRIGTIEIRPLVAG
ncbi:YciI family protein [uncultured Amnibacterium sp.]|uniref:YciI family protein n=1 Tax=uncultured Amnibacterium sp. TaxID=1631851 RepID=UPI0035CC270B